MRWTAANKLWLLNKLLASTPRQRAELMSEYLVGADEVDEWAHAYGTRGIQGLKATKRPRYLMEVA